MRDYSSLFLLEDLLDYIPTTDPLLQRFVESVVQPSVQVITSDCLTTIGKLTKINFNIEGYIEIATDDPLNTARLNTLISAGKTTVAVRDLYNCIAPGGICQRCYEGTYPDKTIPVVGGFASLPPEYNFDTDLFLGNGDKFEFHLSLEEGAYLKAIVFNEGVRLTTGYTIDGSTLTLDTPLDNGDILNVRFYKLTTQPFMAWLAGTYTGSMLGLKPLVIDNIHIRPSLASSLYTQEDLNLVKKKLEPYKAIPSNYLSYADSVTDEFEQALFLSTAYCLYANVTS
jgi:hypothetical protein